LGLIPLSTLPAQQLLGQVRSWIEPSQSFEKNVLGLKSHFLNSLRLAWCLGLMSDAAILLRNLALFKGSAPRNWLKDLAPKQGVLDLGL
jgi:hypothetical protein